MCTFTTCIVEEVWEWSIKTRSYINCDWGENFSIFPPPPHNYLQVSGSKLSVFLPQIMNDQHWHQNQWNSGNTSALINCCHFRPIMALASIWDKKTIIWLCVHNWFFSKMVPIPRGLFDSVLHIKGVGRQERIHNKTSAIQEIGKSIFLDNPCIHYHPWGDVIQNGSGL